MSVNLIIGTQWGDEGKGKVVDFYSKDADYVARFQGGNNAGHTIKVGDEVYKLHIIPSGVIQGKIGVIGNGCVIDPYVLSKEIKELEARGIKPKLFISDRANIIMPYHKILDGVEEELLAERKIGTTKRGIGPCYSDKISRHGIRAKDLIYEDELSNKLDKILLIKQRLFDAYDIDVKLDKNSIINEYLEFGELLKKYITRAHIKINEAIKSDKNILLEGAQGTMLDVDYGSYPYTTSSHTISGGAPIGLGIGPNKIDEIIGVVKAYTTRVGGGPMPTELNNDIGMHLSKTGHEYGTTTNRPRRCGWLDLVVIRHSCMISGITKIALTKLDVLNKLKKIKVCTSYNLDGKNINYFPSQISFVERIQPVYEELEGWEFIDENSKKIDDLPKKAVDYVKFIEKKLNIPVSLISIGPGRSETIEV